jgi:hypothetical protein
MSACVIRGLSAGQLAKVSGANLAIQAAARTEGLPADYVHAIAWVETRHDPGLVSPKGAAGIMQLLPATSQALAADLGVRNDPFDVALATRMGARYLSRLARRYRGSLDHAAAAYYAGAGRVPVGGGIPTIAASYVDAVRRARPLFRGLDPECSGPPVRSRARTSGGGARRSAPQTSRPYDAGANMGASVGVGLLFCATMLLLGGPP